MKKCFIVLLVALVPCFVFAQEKSVWQKWSEELNTQAPTSTTFSTKDLKQCTISIMRTNIGTFRLMTEVFDSTDVPKDKMYTVEFVGGARKRMIAFDMYFPYDPTPRFMGYKKCEFFAKKIWEALDAGITKEHAFMCAAAALYATRKK